MARKGRKGFSFFGLQSFNEIPLRVSSANERAPYINPRSSPPVIFIVFPEGVIENASGDSDAGSTARSILNETLAGLVLTIFFGRTLYKTLAAYCCCGEAWLYLTMTTWEELFPTRSSKMKDKHHGIFFIR